MASAVADGDAARSAVELESDGEATAAVAWNMAALIRGHTNSSAYAPNR